MYFLPVVLEELRDHSYSTKASPMNCFNVNYSDYFNKKCSVSLISLARHHELGAGKVLYQSRERNIGMLRKMSRKLNTNICDTANRPAVLKDRNFYCSVDYSLIFFKK